MIFITFTVDTVMFSQTILGKLIAIMIILFYTIHDPMIGLLVCILMITYYQSDFTERILNNHEYFYIDSEMIPDDTIDDGQYIALVYEDHKNKPKNKKWTKKTSVIVAKEAFTEYSVDKDDSLLHDNAEFRKEFCEGGQLKYKQNHVKDELAEHVFDGLQFTDGTCNPCNASCSYVRE